ncbi:MAG: hypothetical protein AABY75_01985 [Bacteroidota bacterium]
MKIRSLFAVAAVLLFAAGCDKVTDPSASDKPTLAAVSISLPAANFSDTCNAPAYSYAASAQALIQLATAYANPALGTSVNGVWTWSITQDGVTATMTARRLDDGRYSWKLVLNGTEAGSGGTVYTNWTAFEATSSADGKSGTLSIYDDSPTPSTTVDVIVTWSTGASNAVTINVEFVQENMKFVLVSNGTTGEVTSYTKVASTWVQEFHASWTAPGALATC